MLGPRATRRRGSRLALANYLNLKAKAVASARRSVDGRPKRRYFSAGKVVREVDLTDEEYADHLALRHCDPQKLRDQAEQLYEEVITDYGDIPYVTWRHREFEALLKEPAPQWNGKPLTDERRHSLEASLAHKTTLGKEAADKLDVMVNLAVGRPAPEIEGTDMHGKPLRLSDFKGKVVVLNFWGTWCGPCMALVPQERNLVARLKYQPFAFLGVNCKDNRETAQGDGSRRNDLAELVRRRRRSWADCRTLPRAELPIDFRDRCQRDYSGTEPIPRRSRSRRQTPGGNETPNSSSRCVAPWFERKMKSFEMVGTGERETMGKMERANWSDF